MGRRQPSTDGVHPLSNCQAMSSSPATGAEGSHRARRTLSCRAAGAGQYLVTAASGGFSRFEFGGDPGWTGLVVTISQPSHHYR